MTIAKKIEENMSRTSWIRKMFEEGTHLKQKHGPENIYDFTLGNPNLEPPEEFKKALLEAVQDTRQGLHSYMPNIGYPYVRKAVADYLSKEHNFEITENEVIMTCGAAGALNVIFKAILDPGDEVICPRPYFVEYGFYVENHGGVLKTVSTKQDFTLDLKAIENAIGSETKAILINSPNNPTGQIYSKKSLTELGDILRKHSKRLKRTIYLLSDEPYRKIIYDDNKIPSILKCYKESIIATSYSKDISIPGERLGFLVVNSEASYKSDLIAAMAITNRILGFVNAPALMQRVAASIQGVGVDVSIYKKKRELLCDGLTECGYAVTKPAGAFYLFLKAPISDDLEFVRRLQKELILTVPGKGFGGPGYIRIAYCVDNQSIINAMPGFKKVLQEVK
ncbi:putative aspartate aminotransferase YhdR [Candidatus Magnetomoraceae bacterium gMMP-15]